MTVATFTDANPNATVSDFTATITWGDGSTSAGTVVATGNGFAVNGAHTYADEGSYLAAWRSLTTAAAPPTPPPRSR